MTKGVWCLSPCRPLRQQDGVWNPGHRLAAPANLPQGDAEEDSPEHPVWVLPPRVRRPPLGDAHRIFTFFSPFASSSTSRCPALKVTGGVRGHSRCSPRVCVLVYGVYFFFVKRCVLIVLMSSLQCIVNSISVPIYLCMLLPYSHPSYFTQCPFAVQIEIIRWS